MDENTKNVTMDADMERTLRLMYRKNMASRGSVDKLPKRLPAKVGRNKPCPCGSGKKFKRCCYLVAKP